MKISLLLRALIAISSLMLGACAQVEPWERGTLARADMATDPAPLQQQVRRHIYNSREAAPASASRGGGGGCGCY